MSDKTRNDEFILCAAIYYPDETIEMKQGPAPYSEGIVLCGHNHAQVIEIRSKLFGVPTRRPQDIQGFLTSHNRFVGREKAAEIAFKAKQIPKLYNELLSEHLYWTL